MSLTLPSVSFLMNLYSKDVPAGTLTETVHTGYDAEDSAICKGDCVSTRGLRREASAAAAVAHCVVRIPIPELRDAADKEDVLKPASTYFPRARPRPVIFTHLAECGRGVLGKVDGNVAGAAAARAGTLLAGVDGDRAAGGDGGGEGAARDGEPRWTECALDDQPVISCLSSMHLRAACAVATRRRAADNVAVRAIRKRRRERCRPVRVRVVDRHEAESTCTTRYTTELTRTHRPEETYRGQTQSALTAARPSRSTPRHRRCS